MLDRKTPPPHQHSTAFTLLKPEVLTLDNGIPLNLVQGGEQDVVKIEFIFKAGKWYESMPGVAYFTAHQLQKGTAKKSSYQISEALDRHGIHLEVSPGFDFSSLSLLGLTKNITQVFDIVYDVLTQPAFPVLELHQAKDIYKQGLRINLEKTSYLASRQLRQNLFGENHPYGRDASLKDIDALTPEQLIHFHSQHFFDLEVICSGKISDTLRHTLTTLIAAFNKKDVAQPHWNIVNHTERKQHIRKTGTVQSSIRLGKRTIGRQDADYAGLLLLNHIFGGYFGSRLMKNIREEKGLTYGIYSSISALNHDSFMTIGADVNKENCDLTITEIKKEIRLLREKSIEKHELDTARNHFIGSMQSELTTPFAHAEKIKNSILFKLPPNFYQDLILKIDKLSADDVQFMAKKYFDEESFIEVSAG
jgi:zinc protease